MTGRREREQGRTEKREGERDVRKDGEREGGKRKTRERKRNEGGGGRGKGGREGGREDGGLGMEGGERRKARNVVQSCVDADYTHVSKFTSYFLPVGHGNNYNFSCIY